MAYMITPQAKSLWGFLYNMFVGRVCIAAYNNVAGISRYWKMHGAFQGLTEIRIDMKIKGGTENVSKKRLL